MKVLAWSPTQGPSWGFSLDILSGAGPFCVQLFAPPLAFSKVQLSRTFSHEGIGLLAMDCFYCGVLKHPSCRSLVGFYFFCIYFLKDLLALHLYWKPRFGENFQHSGNYVVSPVCCLHMGLWVFLTELGFEASLKAKLYINFITFYTSWIWLRISYLDNDPCSLVTYYYPFHQRIFLNETIEVLHPWQTSWNSWTSIVLFQHCLPVYLHLAFLIPCGSAVAA